MIRAYHQPEHLQDALRLIAQGATPIAGATGLYTAKSKRDLELVDVTRLGLSQIEAQPEHLVLGAGTTIQQIADASELGGMEGALLRRAARMSTTRPLRNAITLGGNIAHMVYWADMPVVLMALEAMLDIEHAETGRRQMPIADCMQAGKQSWERGLITRVLIPRRQGTLGFGYERMSRTALDTSLVTVCATLRKAGTKVDQVRLVVGAVQNRPLLAGSVTALLEGQEPTEALIDKAAAQLAEEITVAPNYRAPTEYRREMVKVLSRRALTTAVQWAFRESK